MRSLVVLCALSSTVFAGWVKGTVVRDNTPGEHLEVHVAIDGGDFIAYNDTAFDIGVAEGNHIFTFAGPEFVTYDQIVHVTKAAMDLGRVDVERGLTIVGRVIDAHHMPLRDVKVIAYTDVIEDVTDLHEVRNHGAQIATTRRDGSFVIHGIGDGIAKVRAFTDKTTSVIQLVSAVRGSLELVVDETGTIVGVVDQRQALRSPVVTASSVTTGDGTAKPILGGIDPTGAFQFELPAGVYDLALDGEKQAPAQVIVVAHHTSKVALAVPTRHGEIAVTAKGCTIIDLYGARPGQQSTQTSIEFGTCDNDRATFSDFPYGTYRVCSDNDVDECKTVKLAGRRATVTLPELHDSLSNP